MDNAVMTAIGEALRGTIAVTSAQRLLSGAKSSLKLGDTLAAVIQAHCALECMLRESVCLMARKMLLTPPVDPEAKLRERHLVSYVELVGDRLFAEAEQTDLRMCNGARNAAYHQATPQDFGVVGRLIEIADSYTARLRLSPETASGTELAPSIRVYSQPAEPSTGPTAKEALLRVLAEHAELHPSALYDEAQKLYGGDRRSLFGARWRLEYEDEAIRYISTRDAYKLSADAKKGLAKEERRAERGMSRREAILRALADNDSGLTPEDLYDAAQKLHGGERQALHAARYQMQNEDPPLIKWLVTQQVYKLTRAGRDAFDDLD